MGYALLGAGLLVVALAGACVKLEREVEVTPGTVPPEVRGARWPDTPVPYCIVRDPEAGGFVEHEALVRLTEEAFAQWGVATTFEGDCEGRAEQGNGRNEVSWGELGTESSSSLARAGNTNIRYRSTPLGGSPDITEADIILDGDPPTGKATEECLLTTLLHETGHFLGVHHLESGTIMSPVISDCLPELTSRDREALAGIY